MFYSNNKIHIFFYIMNVYLAKSNKMRLKLMILMPL